MEEQLNDLGQAIISAGADARYDSQARNLLANKPFLAWILKYTTEEFSSLEPDQIVPFIDNDPKVASVSVLTGTTNRLIDGLPQESNIPGEGKLFYDIRFYAKIPGTSEEEEFNLMFDVEMQNDPYPGYDLVSRGILYCGRMLSEQMGRNVSRKEGTNRYQYQHLQKVYSIWIVANCSRRAANTISRYGMTHTSLYGKYDDHARSDLVNVVIIRLPVEGGEAETNNTPSPLHSMLFTVFSKRLSPEERLHRLENDFGIQVTEKIKKEVTDMCNLSMGIRESEKEDTARRMIEAGKYTEDEIVQISGLSIDRVKEILEEERNKSKSSSGQPAMA